MALRFLSIATSILVSSFLLTACNPRDPEVLSASERACANDRSKCPRFQTNGNSTSGGRGARPTFPENIDVAGANYMLEREEQVVTVLRLADEILKGTINSGECFVITELPPQASHRKFYLESRYPYCFSRNGDAEVRQKGRLLLTLNTDLSGQKLEALVLESEMQADGTSSFQYTLSRRNARRSYTISDDLKLSLYKDETAGISEFQLADYRSHAVVKAIEYNEVKEEQKVNFQTWGRFEIEDRGGTTVLKPVLNSTLSQRASSSGGDSWYDLILSPTKAVGPALLTSEAVMAECGNSQGSRELRFDFIKSSSRDKNILTYNATQVKIEDPKGAMKSTSLKRTQCFKSKDQPTWYGVPGISWDKLLK